MERELSELYLKGVESIDNVETLLATRSPYSQITENLANALEVVGKIILNENRSVYLSSLLLIEDELDKSNNIVSGSQGIILKTDDITITSTIVKKSVEDEQNAVSDPHANVDDHQSAKRRKTFESTPVVASTNGCKGFSDIAGMEEMKKMLKNYILMPKTYPHLFEDARRAYSRILLFGPPGTGKTQLVHALAAEIDSPLYSVTTADFLSSYVGESEKLIRSIFQQCLQSNKYSILFIDEIDSICRIRSSKEEEHSRRVKTELLTQMNILDSNENKFFFLCATNCPWDLDPAFLRRFQRRLYVPLPDKKLRLEILTKKCKSHASDLTQSNWDIIVNQTEGFSGSDLTELANAALFEPIKELEKADKWILSGSKYVPAQSASSVSGTKPVAINNVPPHLIATRKLHIDDFLKNLKDITRTTTTQDIERYKKFLSAYSYQK